MTVTDPQSKHELIAIVGPTATGKTEVAIEVARRLDAEIVSVDAVQLYRYMDIGSAKPTPAQRALAPHHMIDVADPDEEYDVARYRREARAVIAEAHRRGRRVVLVGGSGWYLCALIREGELPPVGGDARLRAELRARFERSGGRALWEELQRCDPVSAARIHPNHAPRLIRALEVYRLTGRPLSAYRGLDKAAPLFYTTRAFALDADRHRLVRAIESRVDSMLRAGMESEVRELLRRGYGDCKPMRSVGYRQMADYLRGDRDLATAVSAWKAATRRYAKRQMTWFRSDPIMEWLPAPAVAGEPEVVREQTVTEILRRAGEPSVARHARSSRTQEEQSLP